MSTFEEISKSIASDIDSAIAQMKKMRTCIHRNMAMAIATRKKLEATPAYLEHLRPQREAEALTKERCSAADALANALNKDPNIPLDVLTQVLTLLKSLGTSEVSHVRSPSQNHNIVHTLDDSEVGSDMESCSDAGDAFASAATGTAAVPPAEPPGLAPTGFLMKLMSPPRKKKKTKMKG